MTRVLRNKRLFHLLIVPLGLLGFSLALAGCGDKEEATEPGETTTAAPVESAVPVEEPAIPATAPPEVAMGDVIPQTLSVLQFMPEGAQVAIALPPVPGMIENAMPIARVFAPEEDVREDITDAFTQMATELGVEADSYESLAEVLGVDPESPFAFFADFTQVAISAAEAAAAESAKAAAPPLEGDGSETPAEGAEGDAGAETDAAAALAQFEVAGEPIWAAVVAVTDAERAQSSLERIAGENEAIQAASLGSEDVDGVTITTRGDYGYFTTGRYLAFGNIELLRGVAARVKSPAQLRYGTVECVASAPDEVAMLIYGGRILPILKEVLPIATASNPDAASAALMELGIYEKMFTADDEDPIVGTLSLNDDQLEMLVRLDTATHPGVLEVSGPAVPLRLARYLPDGTQALVSIRFNDAFKKQIMDGLMNAATASGDPDMAMQMQMGSQFFTQLGDELTIGISAGQGLPELYVLLGLAQPESTQGILQMFVPMEPVGDTSETVVNQIDTPIGMPVYLSFQSDHAIASNSEAGMRAVIERFKAGEVSGLFAAMNPPFDIDLPRYQAAVIRSEIVATALGMAAMFSPGAPSAEEFAPVTTAIREIRTSKELAEGWITGRATIYLGDLDEAARLREAGGLEMAVDPPAEDAAEAPASQ